MLRKLPESPAPPAAMGLPRCSADFDNDGWPDVYVACDTTPNLLYHNNHDGTFTEIGKTAGVAYNEEGSMQAGMGASAGDYAHDGYQDIVKTNFSDDTPTVFLTAATMHLTTSLVQPAWEGLRAGSDGECSSTISITAGGPVF